MIAWIVLLAFVVFFMYLWTTLPVAEEKPGCNTCPKKKLL
jgi:hypothetical protein